MTLMECHVIGVLCNLYVDEYNDITLHVPALSLVLELVTELVYFQCTVSDCYLSGVRCLLEERPKSASMKVAYAAQHCTSQGKYDLSNAEQVELLLAEAAQRGRDLLTNKEHIKDFNYYTSLDNFVGYASL